VSARLHERAEGATLVDAGRSDSLRPVVVTSRQTVALQGLGGIGKSTLVAATAHLRSAPELP